MDRKKDPLKTILVKKLAVKHGVTPAYIYYVLAGDRENEEILNDYFEMKEAVEGSIDKIQNTSLMSSIKQLVPFN